MMQAGIAGHASAVVLPYRSVAVRAPDIIHRTYFLAFPTAYALLLINGEMLVGYEMVMEESAEESAIQARECALVKMLTTTAFVNPFSVFLKPHGCIAYLFLLASLLVEIHERESDVALRHYNGIGSIEMHTQMPEVPGEELHYLSCAIATGAEGVGVGTLMIVLQGETRDKPMHDARHTPSVNGKYESYLLTSLEGILTGCTIL